MRDPLVAAARGGDGGAFACLLEHEVPKVMGAVLAIVRSRDEAQDVIQEASIRAWRRLPSLREDAKWSAWYRQIAVRLALDHVSGRPRLHDLDIDAMDALRVPDTTANAADRLSVMKALGDVSAADRALLGLRFGADLSLDDVAATLGIPVGTVKSRLHRALKRLAEAMGESDVDR